MDLHHQIGRNLRAARVALGWSLAGVAYRMDVREHTVSRWETGGRHLDVGTLYRVAQVLGRDPRDLLPEPSADAVTDEACRCAAKDRRNGKGIPFAPGRREP